MKLSSLPKALIEALRPDRPINYNLARYAVCHNCPDHPGRAGVKHVCRPGSDEAIEFAARHSGPGHNVQILERPDHHMARLHARFGADTFIERAREWVWPDRELVRALQMSRMGFVNYADNANVKVAYANAAVTMTLNSLGSSATAGRESTAVDNTSNLYDDILIFFQIASAAWTADKSHYTYLFPYDTQNTLYTSTGDGIPSGSDAALTFPDVTAHAVIAPLLGSIPTPVTNKALQSRVMSAAGALGYQGAIAPKNGVGFINQGGATLAGSGNNVSYTGVYFTVA